MNKLDLEKTQIWAQKAQEAPIIQAGPVEMEEPIEPTPVTKPTIKKLSKEEIALLAGGGVLTLGLGAIVIANIPSEQAKEVAVAPPKMEDKLPVIEEVKHEPLPAPTPAPAKHAPPPAHHEHHQAAHAHPQEHFTGSLIHVPDEPPVATKPTDEQSFEMASTVARAEVGPGGIFAWRGTFYSTFTEGEWERLPEAQKTHWITAAEPIVEPHKVAAETAPAAHHVDHVMMAERGEITWTGIDKDGDGMAEVLMARVKGQPPVVMMDTDGDGKLDHRFQLDTATGHTVSVRMEHVQMGLSEVKNIPEVASGSSFYNVPVHSTNDSTQLPVSIHEDNGHYIVGVDTTHNGVVDIVSLNKDGETPIIGLDMDNDGQVETGFVYNAHSSAMNTVTIEPLQSMTTERIESESEASDHEFGSHHQPSNEEDHPHKGSGHHGDSPLNLTHLEEANGGEHHHVAYEAEHPHSLENLPANDVHLEHEEPHQDFAYTDEHMPTHDDIAG